jgi:hypothetical protein
MMELGYVFCGNVSRLTISSKSQLKKSIPCCLLFISFISSFGGRSGSSMPAESNKSRSKNYLSIKENNLLNKRSKDS